MSQQIPTDNNTVPHGNNPAMAGGGYVDATPGGYAPQDYHPVAGPDQYPQDGGSGNWQQPQRVQTYSRDRVPMIDPIESAKLTPQILVLLVFAGIKRHWKWSIPLGLLLGFLAAGGLYLAFPLQYQAAAHVQMSSVRPRLLTEDRHIVAFDQFANTQFAIMRSPAVISEALGNSEVARLPVITRLNEEDRRDWVARNLRLRLDGRSEVGVVSFSTDMPNTANIIVNAVVDAYMDHIRTTARRVDSETIASLTGERRRHDAVASQLRNNIIQITHDAAMEGAPAGLDGMVGGFAQGESLLRDLRFAEAQLTAMEARRRASADLISNPRLIPSEIAVGMSPQFLALRAMRDALVHERLELQRTVLNPETDPRIRTAQQEIDRLDAEIERFRSADGDDIADIIAAIVFQEQLNLWAVTQEMRAHRHLVEELQTKYEEQLETLATRSGLAARLQFLRTELNRAESILDIIDTRTITITAEQRAPSNIQVLSRAVISRPNWVRQIAIVGSGAVIFAFLPLVFGIAIERMKPRLYHVSQVRRSINHVLIGEIMEPPVAWIQGASFRKRLARYRESVHNWCTHLLLCDPFRSCKTLSVASVAGDDGKTFLALQIAVAMAQMKSGKVLIIDGDMRVGRLHLLFGNEESGIGLADILSFRNKPWEAILQNEKEQNLELLTAGQLDVSPYELLGDGRFRELLDLLQEAYELIIVVLPPVANAAESLIMASCTDSTLLCVRQKETVLGAMEDVYRKLVNTGASVDGIVVKDIPYYQMAGRDGGFADKLEQIRLSHLLKYAD